MEAFTAGGRGRGRTLGERKSRIVAQQGFFFQLRVEEQRKKRLICAVRDNAAWHVCLFVCVFCVGCYFWILYLRRWSLVGGASGGLRKRRAWTYMNERMKDEKMKFDDRKKTGFRQFLSLDRLKNKCCCYNFAFFSFLWFLWFLCSRGVSSFHEWWRDENSEVDYYRTCERRGGQ